MKKYLFSALLLGLTMFVAVFAFQKVQANDQADNDRVTVCHNGNTIQVSASALATHLSHGDTQGVCEGDCINPDLICNTCFCITLYEPVCGCNGVTYSNGCFARNAGVTSYTPGPCGGF